MCFENTLPAIPLFSKRSSISAYIILFGVPNVVTVRRLVKIAHIYNVSHGCVVISVQKPHRTKSEARTKDSFLTYYVLHKISYSSWCHFRRNERRKSEKWALFMFVDFVRIHHMHTQRTTTSILLKLIMKYTNINVPCHSCIVGSVVSLQNAPKLNSGANGSVVPCKFNQLTNFSNGIIN